MITLAAVSVLVGLGASFFGANRMFVARVLIAGGLLWVRFLP